MGIDPLGLADDGDWALDSGKNYGSWGSYWADAGKEFAEDDQWKAGSCQRKEFSNAISIIPVIGNANQAVIAATGHDYISGADTSGFERGMAIVSTGFSLSNALKGGTGALNKLYRRYKLPFSIRATHPGLKNPQNIDGYKQLMMTVDGWKYEGLFDGDVVRGKEILRGTNRNARLASPNKSWRSPA